MTPLGIGPIDLLDVALVGCLLWGALVWLRRSQARLALPALASVALLYLAARRFGLALTAGILQGFIATSVLVLVVVFQEDLRRLFERLSALGLRRRSPAPPSGARDTLTRTVAQLARKRTGALIVLPGREPLERHLEGGIPLGATLSEPLLLSLFDSSSPGHDGAVLLEGNRVTRFAVHLPLSADRAQLGAGGTRHAAALGLAERTDATCIVVSEERGTVSIARDGRLRVLSGAEALATELDGPTGATGAPGQARSAQPLRAVAAHWREGLAAFALAAGLWLLLGPGAETVQAQRSAVVVVTNLPEGYSVTAVEPAEVEVMLEGRRRDMVMVDSGPVEIELDAFLVKLGRRTFDLAPHRVKRPSGVDALSLEPARVRLQVEQIELAPEPAEAPTG